MLAIFGLPSLPDYVDKSSPITGAYYSTLRTNLFQETARYDHESPPYSCQ